VDWRESLSQKEERVVSKDLHCAWEFIAFKHVWLGFRWVLLYSSNWIQVILAVGVA